MSDATAPKPYRTSVPVTVLRLVIGAALGGGAMAFVGLRLDPLRWADVAAVALSLICILAAVRLSLESLDRRALARRMDLPEDPTPGEARQARLQAGVLAIVGVTLILPVLSETFGLASPWPTLAAVGVLTAVKWAYSLHVTRTADEFIRRRIERASWAILFLFQNALLLYAVAERLGVLPAFTAWDALMVLTAISVVVPLFLNTRVRSRDR